MSCRQTEQGKPSLSKHERQGRKRCPKDRCLNLFCNGKDAFETRVIQPQREKGKWKNTAEKKARRQRQQRSSLGAFQRGCSQRSRRQPPAARSISPGGAGIPRCSEGPWRTRSSTAGLTAARRGRRVPAGRQAPPSRQPAPRPRRPARVLT